ncbi:RIM13 [Candida margitis]|uniref:RIM13 n=1 Tax=Candida margitis TaxID=1775924 RepID=UPI002226B8EC|nr:RIM13 [Candida margitis]KAI5969770.1 RIM13 [Candida margitis]
MSLATFLHHLQQSNLFNAIDDHQRAKSEAIEAIKVLNIIAKNSIHAKVPYLKPLSEYALKIYEKAQEKQPTSTKLLWLSAKIGDSFYFPLIEFGDGLTSGFGIFSTESSSYHDSDPSIRTIPRGVDATFTSVTTAHWVNDKVHLLNIYQDLLTNCSFVSSYIALTNVNFSTYALISPHGVSSKYRIILNFNGCKRTVDVDDCLPQIADSNRNLTLKSFTDPLLYWPALIEKAYLKVMGHGYSFEGSNMANDTYLLSGWIPQVLKLKGNRSLNEFSRLWNMKLHNEVTLGIGTESFSSQFSSSINLIGEHDYVIDDFDGQCITLKNPWVTDRLSTRLVKVYDLTHFKYLYINWKPQADATIYQENFIYTVKDNIVDQPQFTIECEQETWLLLEKHLPVDSPHWMRVNVYQTGNKVMSPFDHEEHSIFETNNRLQSIKLPPGTYTLVIWSNKPGRYSLMSYAILFSKSRYQFAHVKSRDGEWTNETCGGNWTAASYINNPQFDLIVTNATMMKVALFAKGLVNFDIFFADKLKLGQPIQSYNKTKCLTEDKYSQDYQSKQLHIKPGTYKVVVSNFDGSTTPFKLIFNSSEPVALDKIPSSMSLYALNQSFLWNQTNRYKLYFKTNVYNTSILAKIRHTNDETALYSRQTDYRPAMRASIFNAITKEPVQINEKFRDDCLYGLFVEEKLKDPGEYILLIERFEIGKGRCDVVLGSDHKVTLL